MIRYGEKQPLSARNAKGARFGLGVIRLLVAFGIPMIHFTEIAPGREPDGATGANRDRKAEIWAAWRKRQDSVRSYFFEWVDTVTIAKGGMGRPPAGAVTDVAPDAAVPPRDVTLKQRCALLLANRSTKYQCAGEHWSPARNKRTHQEFEEVCHGGERRSLIRDDGGEYPVGSTVRDGTISHGLSAASAIAISLCYRISDSDFTAFALRDLTVFETPNRDSGGKTVVVRMHHGTGHVDLWVDPVRDYVPTRETVVDGDGKVIGDTIISYADDAEPFWRPTEWTTTSFDSNGLPEYAHRCSLTRCTFNQATTEGDFDLPFPVGAWVNVSDKNESFIVLQSGRRHVLLPTESVDDYNRIMRTGDWSHSVALLFCTLVGLAVLVIAFSFIVLARRRGARSEAGINNNT